MYGGFYIGEALYSPKPYHIHIRTSDTPCNAPHHHHHYHQLAVTCTSILHKSQHGHGKTDQEEYFTYGMPYHHHHYHQC